MLIIPSDLISEFVSVASTNICEEDGKLVETLAFLGGVHSQTTGNLIGTHLIFPEQDGKAFRVDDKGKTIQ